MHKHQTSSEPTWFHSRYDGEDRDDGCPNELSIYADPAEPQLDLLLTNVDFEGIGHDNTFAFNRDDVVKLQAFLKNWLEKH